MLVLIWVVLAVFALGFFVAVDEMGYCGLRPIPFVVATVSAAGLVVTIGVLSFALSEIAARDRYDEQRIYLYERMKDRERAVTFTARDKSGAVVWESTVVEYDDGTMALGPKSPRPSTPQRDPGTVILPDHVTQRGNEG